MGRKLKTIKVDGGMFMSEKACEDYTCAGCGQKMISINFVNGICIQVFCSHADHCRNFSGNAFRRTVEVTCETCRYYNADAAVCVFEGARNADIDRVRTHL